MEELSEFEKIRKEGRLLLEYIRGSTLYGLNTPDSDVDTGGIFICKPEEFLGFLNYKSEVSDNKHDNTWYEIGNFIKLLAISNPTVLEALFIPDDKIIGKVHPLMKILRDNKEKFITKECFNSFYGYAKSQIEKARGPNKKIINPVSEKSILDFAYTFFNQGSTKILYWLEKRGLKQNHCGLVNIPNMPEVYGVYYDFGGHISNEKDYKNNRPLIQYLITYLNKNFTLDNVNEANESEYEKAIQWLSVQKNFGYKGMLTDDKNSKILRLSSIDSKDDRPICYISYNFNGYSKYCSDYKSYKKWEKERNPKRYESNLNSNYDSKNIMHCFRLIHMAKEIAEGKGIIVKRTDDHDFLMKVRNHEFEYEEIMKLLDKEKEEMEQAIKKCTLPEKIDVEFANNIIIEIRKKQMKDFVNS